MRLTVLAVLPGLFVSSLVFGQAAGDVGIVGGSIKVRPGTSKTTQIAVLFATGAEIISQPPDDVTVIDISGTIKGSTVTFSKIANIGISKAEDNKTTRYEWQATIDVDGLPPNTTQTRHAVIQTKNGTAKRAFTYELTNKATPLTWTLNPPPSAVDASGVDQDLLCSVTINGDGQSTRVVVSRMTLRDAMNRVVPVDALAVEDKDVAIGMPVPLKVMVRGSKIAPGNYSGIVELAAVGAADAKTFDLAIASSNSCARLIGFFCVLAGVLVAFTLGGLLRNYAARLTALMPARRLHELAEQERDALGSIPLESTKSTITRLLSIMGALDSRTLSDKDYIPSRVPFAFGSALDAAAYTQYLQERSDELKSVTYIVERGFLVAAKDSHDETRRKQAYAELDSLAAQWPPDPKSAVDGIITALQQTALKAAPASVVQQQELSVEQLHVRVEVISLTAWLFWATISALVGYLAAVNIAGFGLTADYLKAFLWGLGLQTAGTQMSQLTPSGIASTIGIALPKAS